MGKDEASQYCERKQIQVCILLHFTSTKSVNLPLSFINLFFFFFFFFNFLFSVSIILRLVSEAIQKMKGKIPEIAGSHISSRVLQVSFLAFSLQWR